MAGGRAPARLRAGGQRGSPGWALPLARAARPPGGRGAAQLARRLTAAAAPAVDKKLHATAEECRRLDAELLALRRDSAALGDASRRAQQELGEGRERLRSAQYEAQRRCQQAEGERAALAEQLAALREHAQGGRPAARGPGCASRAGSLLRR